MVICGLFNDAEVFSSFFSSSFFIYSVFKIDSLFSRFRT